MRLFKRMLLIFITVLCANSCKENEFLEAEEIINSTQETIFSSRVVFQNEIQTNILISEKLRLLNDSKNIFNSENENDSFIVDTNLAKYVEINNGSLYSYTFLVKRSNDNSSELENLVLNVSSDTGEIEASLIKYYYTSEQRNELIRTGHVSTHVEITATQLNDDFSSLLTENNDIPCTFNTNTYHVVQNEDGTDGNTYPYGPHSQCEHINVETGETDCEVYTVLTVWCPQTTAGSAGTTTTTTQGTPTTDDSSNNTTNGGQITQPNSDNSNDNDFDTVSSPLLTAQQEIGNCVTLSIDESNWLNLRENNDVALEINEIIQSEGCNLSSQSFVQDVLNALMNDDNLTYEEFLAEQLVFEAPDHPIEDIADYLSCFDLTQGATITIYVDQPRPGSRKAWTLGGDVGHAFVGITQGGTTRVLGLYPNGDVSPASPEDPLRYGNNAGDAYDVSITKNITSLQLQNVINETITNTNNYNLNLNNCSNYAIRMCLLSQINVPSTLGTWPLGGGNNPGDLGEDIRGVNQADTTRDLDGGTASENQGDC